MHKCFQCGEEFTEREDMHHHRKITHRDIKPCEKFFLTGNCRFKERCWWSHENDVVMKSPQKSNVQVFQNPVQNPFPPIKESLTNSIPNQQTNHISNQSLLMMLKTIEENMRIIKLTWR